MAAGKATSSALDVAWFGYISLPSVRGRQRKKRWDYELQTGHRPGAASAEEDGIAQGQCRERLLLRSSSVVTLPFYVSSRF